MYSRIYSKFTNTRTFSFIQNFPKITFDTKRCNTSPFFSFLAWWWWILIDVESLCSLTTILSSHPEISLKYTMKTLSTLALYAKIILYAFSRTNLFIFFFCTCMFCHCCFPCTCFSLNTIFVFVLHFKRCFHKGYIVLCAY